MIRTTLRASTGTPAVYLGDYRNTMKQLALIEPTVRTDLRREYRRISKPGQQAVRKAISNKPPTRGIHLNRSKQTVSGFYPIVIPGRVTWGTGKPAKSVTIETRLPRLRVKGFNSIVRLRVGSAATVIADLAGSSRKYINKRPVTREYEYAGPMRGVPLGTRGTRKHRINGQGLGMIKGLNLWKRGRSRVVYPAFDKAAPQIRQEALAVLMATTMKINKRLIP